MPMSRPRVVALLVLAVVALAGCTAPEGDVEVEPLEADEPSARDAPPQEIQPGRLVVVARMPDLTLLGGVNVTVGNTSRLTDAKGEAAFGPLPAGTYPLEARKEAHRTAQQAVEVVAGEETRVDVVLAAASNDQHAHENGARAHRDVYRFEGRFDCSATYLIITGDCLVLLQNASEQTGLPDPASGSTEERHLIDFPLDLNWTTLIVEMVWTPQAATPATGEGMTLALEPADAPAGGHAVKYARASGGSPLALRLESGVHHETATAEDMPNPLGGEVIRARAFVMGAAHRPGGTEFLGVGASLQHEFQLLVSIFYGETPEEGYSAIGAA